MFLNVIVFVATFVLSLQNIDLNGLLGSHYLGSPLFQPYQIISHMFAHGDFWHLFLNMWLFVMLGGFLDQLWGPKRFFFFFISCGLGAFFLYNIVGAYELYELRQALAFKYNMESIDQIIKHAAPNESINDLNRYIETKNYFVTLELNRYVGLVNSTMLGASGAVYGVLVAFGLYFKDAKLALLFFPVPIAAKYFIPVMILGDLFFGMTKYSVGNIAHFAHIGGALIGFIIAWHWKNNQFKVRQ